MVRSSHRQSRFPLFGALLLLAFSAPLVAQDWAGRGRIQGTVTDTDGKPIEGAVVKLSPANTEDEDHGPEPITTNKKGRWSFLGLKNGTWRIVVDAEGYIGSEGVTPISEFGSNKPVIVKLPPNPTASIDIGNRLLEEGKYAEARAEYGKALPNLDPDTAARLRTRIADSYFEEGNYEAARAEYEATLPVLTPGEKVHVYLQMAQSYEAEDRHEEARTAYRQAIPNLGPAEQVRIYLSIAQSYGREGNNDEAIKVLDEALQNAPDDPVALQLIADLLSRAGREAEAEEYLARLPEDTKLPPDMRMNLGIRLYNDGELDGALDHFEKAVAENPNLADAYYYRGLIYLAKERQADAKGDFEKLLEIAPDHANAAEAREFLSFLDAE